MTNLPIACTLGPAALKARREGLLATLLQRAVARNETADGCRLQFDAAGDVLEAIARAVDAERRCCRFLRFRITIEPDEGAIVLDLTGPPGSREFLAALLDT